MQITHSTEINDSVNTIWSRLSSFEGVETYLPIVTKSSVFGKGKGAKRTCEINLRNQIFQIQETIKEFDDLNHFFVVSLDDGPIQIRGMNFTFSLKSHGDKKSNLTMSTDVVNPDAQSMAKNLFEMIGQGLKKIHEL